MGEISRAFSINREQHEVLGIFPHKLPSVQPLSYDYSMVMKFYFFLVIHGHEISVLLMSRNEHKYPKSSQDSTKCSSVIKLFNHNSKAPKPF